MRMADELHDEAKLVAAVNGDSSLTEFVTMAVHDRIVRLKKDKRFKTRLAEHKRKIAKMERNI